MQGRDLYNLQEAYLEVYDNLNEASGGIISGRLFPQKKKKKTRNPYDRNTIPGQIRRELWDTWHATINQYGKVGQYPKSPEEKAEIIAFANRPDNPLRSRAKKKPKGRIEKVDGTWKKVKVEEAIEMILLHLLDEGYANSIESAEVILENMSEGWIENIMEGLTGKRYMRAIEKGFEHLATAREGSSIAKRKGFNLPTSRGGSGTRRAPKARMYPDPTRPDSDRPQTPSGGWKPILQRPDVKGHKSRRRAGLEVPDNENRYYRNDNSPDF